MIFWQENLVISVLAMEKDSPVYIYLLLDFVKLLESDLIYKNLCSLCGYISMTHN